MPRLSDRLPPSAMWGLYLFCAVLFFSPIVDLVVNVWPIQVTNLQWRYGFLGLASGFLHTPILALCLAVLTSHLYGDRTVLRGVAVLSLLAAAAVAAGAAVFVMDVLALPDAPRAGASLAAAKHVTAFAVLALLGIGSWKSST